MGKEMSGFDSDLDREKVKRILEEIVERSEGKIWIARRIGRRVSYLDGLKAGNEMYEPYEILHDDGEYVIFSEGVRKDEWIEKRIEEILDILRRCQ